MATQGPSYYSYYTSKTVRTLRGLLDAGVTAAGWSSTSSQANTSSAKTSEEGDDDTLRAVGLPAVDSDEAHGGRIKRANGSRKNSRPGVGQLFEEVQEPAVDQLKAQPRHSESSRRDLSSLDRVLFYTGTSSDVYDAGSEERLPLLALCPCNLPTELTDLVVAQLTARLDSHAQEAYMLVLFASPSSPIPVQHLIRYYRGLSPEVRRNIQRLWIVHAGLFTKM